LIFFVSFMFIVVVEQLELNVKVWVWCLSARKNYFSIEKSSKHSTEVWSSTWIHSIFHSFVSRRRSSNVSDRSTLSFEFETTRSSRCWYIEITSSGR